MTRLMPDAELAKAARAIVAQLGEGWAVNEEWARQYSHNLMVDGPDRMQINIGQARQSGRLAISSSYPHIPGRSHIGDRYPHVEITADAGRDPVAIARQIERKLLPEYGQHLRLFLADLAEENQMRKNREALAAKILKVAPKARFVHEETSSSFDLGRIGCSGRMGYEAGEMSLDLSWLPVEDALRIIEIAAKAPSRI